MGLEKSSINCNSLTQINTETYKILLSKFLYVCIKDPIYLIHFLIFLEYPNDLQYPDIEIFIDIDILIVT